MVQSQTPTVCISSSGQSCLSDRRIINELKFFSCICISTNNSDTLCICQDTSILVQNSSYCCSLAPVSMVFRGVTTISISSNLSFTLSKTTDTIKRKVQQPNLPLLYLHSWELSSNQSDIKIFSKRC